MTGTHVDQQPGTGFIICVQCASGCQQQEGAHWRCSSTMRAVASSCALAADAIAACSASLAASVSVCETVRSCFRASTLAACMDCEGQPPAMSPHLKQKKHAEDSQPRHTACGNTTARELMPKPAAQAACRLWPAHGSVVLGNLMVVRQA